MLTSIILSHSLTLFSARKACGVYGEFFHLFVRCHICYFINGLAAASKGAPYFHSRFLEFVVEELKKDMDFTKGKNNELNHEVIYQFFGTATVGIVEWWFANGMPLPPQVIAEQVGALLDRNL
jgi:hypothetical protein